MMLADGGIARCDRQENAELFSLVLGGYGLFGVVLDVELRVVPNERYRLEQIIVPATEALDANKLVTGFGLTLHAGKVFDLDLVYGHVFLPDRQIRNTEITQPTAIRPAQAPVDQSHIANGNYTMEADFAGIGSTFYF